jgi:hypothetical protein
MTITYHDSTSAGNSSGTDLSIDAPINLVSGDLLVAVLYREGGLLTLPDGWSQSGSDQASSNGGNLNLTVAWKIADGLDIGGNWTFELSTTVWRTGVVSAFTTGGTVSVDVASVGANTPLSNAQDTVASITTNVANTMVISAHGNLNGSLVSPATGYSEAVDLAGVAIHYKAYASAGATGSYTSAFGTTLANNGDWATLHVAFKETSSATVEQEGFRFGVDDGSESAHGWEASQDTNISTASPSTKLIRFLLNSTGDYASTAFKLKYQKNGAGGYATVPLTATSSGTTPLIEAGDATQSGNDTASASWALSTPTASTGDLLIFCLSWDDSVTTTDVTAPAGKASETLTAINATPATDASTETRSKVWYCICAGDWTAGTITFTPSASESWTGAVIRVPAGEFDATTPIGASATRGAAAITESQVQHASFTAGSTDGNGRLCVWTSADTDPQAVASGFLAPANTDRGTVSGGFFIRSASVTNSESFSVTSVSTIAGDSWSTVAFVVRAPIVTNDLYISTSSNITAGGEATTARLTAPTGKTTSDFVTGRRWDDENGTDSIDITTDDYTEVEFPITLRTGLTDTTYFDFRMYNADVAINTYTVTPRWTVASVTTATGTLNKTLGALTRSTAGTVLVSGTTSKTLGSLTKSIAGTVLNNGSLSKTLGALTSVSTVDVIVQGTLDKTLGSITLASAGTVESATSTGTLTKTLGSLSSVGVGTVIVSGTTSKSLGLIEKTIGGTVLVSGTTSKILGILGKTISGTVLVSGSTSKTLGEISRTLSGTVLVNGNLSKTLGGLTRTLSASVTISGATSKTLGSLVLSSTATTLILGITNKILGALTKSIVGNTLVQGTTNKLLGGLSKSILANAIVQATTNKTLGTLAKTISGTVLVTGSVNKTLGTASLVSSGTVANTVYTATLDKTLGSLTASSLGNTIVAGTTNKTLGAVTLFSTGSIGDVVIVGLLNKTLGGISRTISGTVLSSGTLNKSLDTLNTAITGDIIVDGDLSYALGSLGISSSGTVAYPIMNQEGFRFRYDDGSEATATWMQPQDTDTKTSLQEPFRLRVLVDSDSVTDSDFQIEYRKLLSTSPVLWGEWKKV